MQPKLPPHSIDAEQSVIGGLLLSDSAWFDVADKLTAAEFYREDHRLIFEAIASLADNGEPYDVVTVPEWLRARDQLDRVGTKYLGNLAMNIASAANIRAYAKIVRDHAMARKLIKVGDSMVESGFEEHGRSIIERLDEAERDVGSIRDVKSAAGPVGAREVAAETIDAMEAAFNATSDITGLPTGLIDLDRKTGGLQPGDLIYIAGRPSMGKTALAAGIAEHAALEGGNALIFSLEMSRRQIMQRAASRHGDIPLESVLNPKRMAREEWDKTTQVFTRLSQCGLYIDDTPSLTIMDVRARARRLNRKSPLSVVVLDYIQMMSGEGKPGNRNSELEPISRGLKSLAKELGIPVIALSQLNRQVEQRDNKRPRMSDLRDSGNLEQDADLIVFVYRDEVYRDDSPHEGVAELIIGKQRNGPLGVVDTLFEGPYTRFRAYSGPSKAQREGRNKVTPIKAGRGGFNYVD